MKSFAIIILALILYSCEKQNEKINSIDTFSITYSKRSAWVNYSFDAVIMNDSLHLYENNGIYGQIKHIKYKIPSEEINLIRENMNCLINTDLNNYYGFGSNIPTDLPVELFRYETLTKSDSTSIMFPSEHELPKPLDSLLVIINRIIVNSEK